MHELTLILPDELYTKLHTKAASKGTSVERLIVEQFSTETFLSEQQNADKRLLHEVQASTGLVQPVSADLISTYISDPSAPRRSPIEAKGKPLSTLIIEQRGSL